MGPGCFPGSAHLEGTPMQGKKEGKGKMKEKVEEELKFEKCQSKRKIDVAKHLQRKVRGKAAFGMLTLQVLLLCVFVCMWITLFSEVKMFYVNILNGEKKE